MNYLNSLNNKKVSFFIIAIPYLLVFSRFFLELFLLLISTFFIIDVIKDRVNFYTDIVGNFRVYYYQENKNVEMSLKIVTEQLKGTWGLAILCIDTPNKIYCTRHGSPLLVGIENNMVMVTSEQSGFCNLFNKYIHFFLHI